MPRPAATLPPAQRRILECLADGRLYSFREIAQCTGQHSGLSSELNHRHERGIGSKGLAGGDWIDVGTDKVLGFHITPSGCRVLGVPVPDTLRQDTKIAVADFIERWRAFMVEFKQQQREAASIGLRRNPYCLLRALASDPDHPFTFAELTKLTGIFSGLTQDLRARNGRHTSNLGHLGLCIEGVEFDNDDKRIFTFQATSKGLALLKKAYDHGEPPPPTPKPKRGRRSRLAPPLPCYLDDDET